MSRSVRNKLTAVIVNKVSGDKHESSQHQA
jgi:hypothetical protein